MDADPDKRCVTPAEFLAEIRFSYALRVSDLELQDPELLRLTEDALKRSGEALPDPADPYAVVIKGLGDRLVRSFADRYQADFANCAIGALEHPTVNARCFRSPAGLYAIVLHHGLMALLHKYTKLLAAAIDPSAVVYCNRKPAEELTSEELREWWEELGTIYLARGEVGGARVKLTPEATVSATGLLLLSEAFVLGHEIGHMVAGHMEDRDRLVADELVPWLQFLPENDLHAYEFEADDFGWFGMSSYAPGTPKPVLLASLLTTFNTLSVAGAAPNSTTHPAAMSRVQSLVEKNFSAETARLMGRWTQDGDVEAAISALDTAH
jgi:hypothetical protein